MYFNPFYLIVIFELRLELFNFAPKLLEDKPSLIKKYYCGYIQKANVGPRSTWKTPDN